LWGIHGNGVPIAKGHRIPPQAFYLGRTELLGIAAKGSLFTRNRVKHFGGD